MKYKSIILSLLICATVVALAAGLASSYPDGLERVAAKIGFEERAVEKNIVLAPMPDYTTKFLNEGVLANVIAGLSGVLAVFLVAWFFGWVIGRRKRRGERVEQVLDRS